MNGSRIAGLVAGLLVIAGGVAAQGEGRPPYKLPDTAVTTGDLEAILKRRQLQAENLDGARKCVEDLLKGKVTSNDVRRLQQALRDNPEFRRQVEQNLQRPDLRKAFEDVLKEKRVTRD